MGGIADDAVAADAKVEKVLQASASAAANNNNNNNGGCRKKGEEATKAYVSFTSNREKIIVGIFAKAMTYNGKQAACTCTNA